MTNIMKHLKKKIISHVQQGKINHLQKNDNKIPHIFKPLNGKSQPTFLHCNKTGTLVFVQKNTVKE